MAVFVVTTLDDEAFGGGETVGTPDGAGLSLREALGLGASGDIVRYDSGLAGGTSVLTGSAVNIDHNVTLDGDTDNDGAFDIIIEHNATLFSLGAAGASFVNDGARFLMDRSAADSSIAFAVSAFADNVSITNGGEIETIGNTTGSSPDRTGGIFYNGDDFSFVNEADGSIVAGGYHALTSGYNNDGYNPTGTSITNHGLLQSSDDVIRISHGSVLNTGTIQTTGAAAASGRTPDGISAFGEFDPSFVIPLSGLFDITNTASGLIEGVRAGLYVNGGGMIDNAGQILAEESAILVQGAGQNSETTVSILNSGLIESTGEASFLDEREAAAVSFGEGLGLVGAAITNSGVIQSANKAIASYVGMTLTNELSGSIVSDSDNANDDAVAFQGAEYADFALRAAIGFPSGFPGLPLISSQNVTISGLNGGGVEFDTPVGTFTWPNFQIPAFSLYGRITIDAPWILPLIDLDATAAAGGIVFLEDMNGDYVFPDEIDVPITGYGVLTLKWRGDDDFAFEDASGDPVFFIPAGLSLADDIYNAGAIDGDILTGAGDDFARNDGTIIGIIDLGSDNDEFDGARALSAQEVFGGFGDDELSGGAFADTLEGGAGKDLIFGKSGDDFIRGGTENDDLRGSLGNDTVYGDNGRDFLRGNGGDDDLRGGAGGDTMDGGLDNDELRAASGDDTLKGGFGNDLLSAGIDDDLLYGNDGVDTLYGGDGADSLFGNPGDDLMFGEAGDDDLRGGNDNDTMDGGAGNDTLRGNSGDDVFVYAPGADDDIIIGFEGGAGAGDVIDLSVYDGVFDDFADVQAAAADDGFGNVVIDLGGGDSITLMNVLQANLDADDFIFGVV